MIGADDRRQRPLHTLSSVEYAGVRKEAVETHSSRDRAGFQPKNRDCVVVGGKHSHGNGKR